MGQTFCWPIVCRGDSTTTRRTWSTIQQRSLDRPLLARDVGVEIREASCARRLAEDFADIDSMYSAYDNWHRGMIISRSASFPRRSSSDDRTQERGEGSSLGAIADERMFLPPQGGGVGVGGQRQGVPFFKTLLSNLGKNNQTYTVNED